MIQNDAVPELKYQIYNVLELVQSEFETADSIWNYEIQKELIEFLRVQIVKINNSKYGQNFINFLQTAQF